MHTISATELARRTSEILDTVSARGEIVMVERNRMVVARITPPERSMTAAQALAGLEPVMTSQEADAWLHESQGTFDATVRDPWA